MKVLEVLELFKSGEISLDLCGHIYRDDLKDKIIENTEHQISYANGANDNKWNSIERGEDPEKVNADMRQFYQRRLDDEVVENEHCFGLSEIIKIHCFCCGEDVHPTLSGNILKFNCCFTRSDDSSKRRYYYDVDYNCPLEYGLPLKGVINISEKMVLANFIPTKKADCPEDENRYDSYSLNNYLGRKNITEWKAKAQNVAYGQTGSCGSTTVWLNENKNHVIISEHWWDEEDKPKELEGFKDIGTTEVAVWRFEATDTATTDMVECKKVWKEMNHDYVIAKVKPGKWEFTTYYDQEGKILAELKLVKDN